MPRVQAGEVQLGLRVWGGGDIRVVFIHGNLASKDWIELAAPLFPSGLRVIGIDWRGCGESDRPKPAADYSNYSMQQHALDMLAALDALDIDYCHLATHSTGGIIAARMMATAASSLFVPESLAPDVVPRFREGLGEIQSLFERVVEQTFSVSEGIW